MKTIIDVANVIRKEIKASYDSGGPNIVDKNLKISVRGVRATHHDEIRVEVTAFRKQGPFQLYSFDWLEWVFETQMSVVLPAEKEDLLDDISKEHPYEKMWTERALAELEAIDYIVREVISNASGADLVDISDRFKIRFDGAKYSRKLREECWNKFLAAKKSEPNDPPTNVPLGQQLEHIATTMMGCPEEQSDEDIDKAIDDERMNTTIDGRTIQPAMARLLGRTEEKSEEAPCLDSAKISGSYEYGLFDAAQFALRWLMGGLTETDIKRLVEHELDAVTVLKQAIDNHSSGAHQVKSEEIRVDVEVDETFPEIHDLLKVSVDRMCDEQIWTKSDHRTLVKAIDSFKKYKAKVQGQNELNNNVKITYSSWVTVLRQNLRDLKNIIDVMEADTNVDNIRRGS